MHDTRALGLLLLVTAALAGCGNLQHNDVLVFATDTKLALDVSPSATNGGAPSFTLGYKRAEGVWMPLVINGTHSTVLNGQKICDATGKCLPVSTASLEAFKICAAREEGPPIGCLRALSQDIKYTGSGGGRTDTYSVFASFGADTGASGGGKATLAQFFATGVAAQRLAGNPNVEQALIGEEPDADRAKAAERAAKEAKAERDAVLRDAGAKWIDARATEDVSALDAAMACWRNDAAAYRAKASEKLGANDPLVAILNRQNEAEVRNGLKPYAPELGDKLPKCD